MGENPTNSKTSFPVESLIAGQYRPDLAAQRNDAGRGHTAFAVLDRRGHATDTMALQVERGTQPRAPVIAALAGNQVAGILNPLGFGVFGLPGQAPASFVICQAPPGPSLLTQAGRSGGRINDLELIEMLLRPAAHALDTLAQRGFTHRAIRPDNIFSPGRGQPAILGAAWATPPGALQPSIYDPPYLSQCHPHGRGDGVIADDVYALGVSLLVLCLGEAPLRAMDDEAILRRKLHLGSYAALVEEARLSSALSDLLRGMLAEDPDHRPPPALLTDPAAARARRVAARPPRRASRPLEIGNFEAWNARSLAYALARFPEPGMLAIKSGAVDRWLRRMLGDATMGLRFDLAVNATNHEAADGPLGDTMRLARATAALDPLAPFHWRGLTFWPDALGALLAASIAQRDTTQRIEEIIDTEAVVAWAEARPERCDPLTLRPEARRLRLWLTTRGLTGQLPRVLYGLNPALPCRSPLVGGAVVMRLADLLQALEQTASHAERRQGLPADPQLMSYIAAHGEHRLDSELSVFANCPASELPVALLRVFAGIQITTDTSHLPNLTAWLAAVCADRVEQWRGRHNRKRLATGLKQRAEAGMLSAMLDLLEDRSGRAQDRANAEQAATMLRRIEQELAQIEAGSETRAVRARGLAYETIGAVALAGVIGAGIFAAFS
jgi:hypothetical protein